MGALQKIFLNERTVEIGEWCDDDYINQVFAAMIEVDNKTKNAASRIKHVFDVAK